jgi:hypothetical protein
VKPPIVPEKPVPILTENQLPTWLAGAESNSFVDRRDNAIMRLLIDTGGQLSAQPAGIRWYIRVDTGRRLTFSPRQATGAGRRVHGSRGERLACSRSFPRLKAVGTRLLVQISSAAAACSTRRRTCR